MTNFPILTKETLKPDQRPMWDELTLGPRGFYTGGSNSKRLPDLYNAWLQFPEFGQLILQMGEEIRKTDFPGNLREVIVLTTSAMLGAQVEHDFHIPFARSEGISDAVISAIGEGRKPPFTDDAERVVYEANLQFLRTATLAHQTRDDLVKILGHRGIIQLIAIITVYIATAFTTNVARVKLLDDFSADPEKLNEWFTGKR